ncbi:MAG: VacJ family lipoprotein, partial [Rhodobacteraceae bacterium]|nr:VacJ family lipoprotein [Paracoccaceae bacterium]
MKLTIPSLSVPQLAFSLVFGLAACGPAPAPQGINDPYETENRATHAFNVALDRNIIKPMSAGLGSGGGPVSEGIGNFADNLGTPGDVVNNLLQVRVGQAT